MSFWFFTSYARADRDLYVDRFFEELREEVRRKGGLTGDVGFFDTKSIETGDEWDQALGDALRTSRILICLCSPYYFKSSYCGKEYQVFCERREAWLRELSQTNERARVIFPVLWERPDSSIPEIVSQFQYSDDDFPEVYTIE